MLLKISTIDISLCTYTLCRLTRGISRHSKKDKKEQLS